MLTKGSAWDTSPMGFRVPGTEIPGTPVPGTANPRDSWDLGQILLGVPGTGTVKFCCPTALGLCGKIWDNRPSCEKNMRSLDTKRCQSALELFQISKIHFRFIYRNVLIYLFLLILYFMGQKSL